MANPATVRSKTSHQGQTRPAPAMVISQRWWGLVRSTCPEAPLRNARQWRRATKRAVKGSSLVCQWARCWSYVLRWVSDGAVGSTEAASSTTDAERGRAFGWAGLFHR